MMDVRVHLFKTTLNYLFWLLFFTSIGISYSFYKQHALNQEARRFIDVLMLGLLTDWNEDTFLRYASTGLQKHITAEQLEDIRSVLVQLGPLLNYYGTQGELFRSSYIGWQLAAQYQAYASFQEGQMIAKVTLVKQQEHWVIARFRYEYVFFPMPEQSSSLKLAGRDVVLNVPEQSLYTSA
jgi:hypothetical protein